MHRVTGATWGAVGIGLVAAFLVTGFVLGGIPMAPLASPGHSANTRMATDLAPAAPRTASKAVPAAGPARTYQTQIAIYINQLGTIASYNGWYTSAVPTDFTFSTNITWGAISAADTHVSVNITDEFTGQYRLLTYPTNFSFDPSKVVFYNNNGVLYQNYSWTVPLDAVSLGCGTQTSCAKVLASDDLYQFAVIVSENGASVSGGLASSTAYSYAYLVGTFTWGTLITPSYYQTPVPFAVEFNLNTSWGYTSNATTNVTFIAYDYDTGATYWVSYNGTLGTTATSHNGISVSSTKVFNGTVAGIPYSSFNFFVTLNKSFFDCKYYSCNSTFGQGDYVGLWTWIEENGSTAGGSNLFGWYYSVYDDILVGSTLYYAGQSVFASSPQGLPDTVSGWLNTTWVNPSTTGGNKTITGFIELYNETVYTGIPFAYISLNKSVGTVNSDGFSLTPVVNGTVPVTGITYTNYTWSLDLSASNLGANLPYADSYSADLFIWANGTAYGGVNESAIEGCTPVCFTSFAEYPTTVSLALSSALPGYVPFGYMQNFTISVANAPITPLNTAVVVTIYDATLTKELGSLLGPDVISSQVLTTADNQTAYSFSFNQYAMSCNDAACSLYSSFGFPAGPTDIYYFNITTYVDGIGAPTNGTFAVSYYQASFLCIFTPLTFYLVSPTPSAVITPGNLTVSVFFQGTFISGPLTLNVYSPTGALVLSESFATSGQNFTWVVTSAGTYHASLSATTAYLINGHSTHYSNTTLVVTKVPRVYVNSTAYSNATLVPGLSAAGAGTLLLVLGLIIGMIVALLLGRAVWGGRQAPTPPQAWETKPAEGAGAGAAAGAGAGTAAAAGTNTCSVCGKSFATPDELTAHGKSEHGME